MTNFMLHNIRGHWIEQFDRYRKFILSVHIKIFWKFSIFLHKLAANYRQLHYFIEKKETKYWLKQNYITFMWLKSIICLPNGYKQKVFWLENSFKQTTYFWSCSLITLVKRNSNIRSYWKFLYNIQIFYDIN